MRDEDHDRFVRCWTQAQASIAGYVNAVVQDDQLAEDVLQDIAVTLLRKFPEYDPARPFIAWAMGIAKIGILTMRRDRARAAARFSRETIESLAEVWEELLPKVDERREALGECLRLVSGRNRELVTLRYEQELEPQQIAGRLNLSPGAVRIALMRVRTALQECIERRLGAEGAR
jgi:RNA polymerase sigma-70 factor (ECF subfamily)